MRRVAIFLFWLLVVIFVIVLSASAQPVTRPNKEEWPIYGPSGSLIGVVRYWNPSYFYPIHYSYRKYINRYDRAILETPWKLDSLLKDKKFVWVRHADTLYLPH
jgi:hypothetical protein